MTALRAKLYEPDPPKPKLRSAFSLIRSLIDRAALPWDELSQGDKGLRIENVAFDGLQARDLSTATGATGGYLTKSTTPLTLAEALQAQTVCSKAGAQFHQPNGDWTPIPRRATPATAYWINADGGTAPTESNGTFGSIGVAVKEIAANVDWTRNLQLGTNGLIERMLLAELTQALAVGLDKAALTGTGADSQPSGISLICAANSFDCSTATWTKILTLPESVEKANATPTAYVCSPTTKKLLQSREKATGLGFILANGMIDTIPCYSTTSIADGTLICGDFSQLLVLAESLQLIVNRYTQSKTGIIEITGILFCDVAVRHSGAFAIGTGVS